MSREKVLEAVRALPEAERIQLLEELLETFALEDDGMDDAAFAAELERRNREIDQGTAELVPWSELKNESW